MKVSVVLLTYNAGDAFRRVVEALRTQDVRGEIEYVAVDSGSTDGTCEIMEEAGFRLYRIEKKAFSFGPVRDYAFRCSAGDAIITQSQDVLPFDATYIRAMVEPIENGQAEVVQGITSIPPEDKQAFIWDRMGVAYFTREGREFMRGHGNVGLSCSCLAISRNAWLATGFGDTPYAEDKLIQRRLAEKGFRMVLTTGPVAWHGHSYTFRTLIRRCLNEGIGWRNAGVRYSLDSCLRDLSVGFLRHLPMWWRAVYAGQVRGAASLLFFQIRPVCLWIGNHVLKNVLW